ncbi:septum formation initiator family protein [Mucilaginibacter koreensis]
MKLPLRPDMKRLIDLLKNKFFLVTLVFIAWMLFFDKNDLFSQYEYRQQLSKLEQERDFYLKETAQVSKELDELSSNRAKLEKFAREKYLMKKDNEDVFVIVKEKKEEKKSLF